MSKDTPSMAKNKIRRSLLAILDPYPSKAEVDGLWQYFNDRCAYCGVGVERQSRTGHIDHVIASTIGGGNGTHNCVLSCARCNGDEKRDEDWRAFLYRKSETEKVAAMRAARIESWISLAPAAELSEESICQAQAIIADVISHYESAVEQIRALRQVGA